MVKREGEVSGCMCMCMCMYRCVRREMKMRVERYKDETAKD